MPKMMFDTYNDDQKIQYDATNKVSGISNLFSQPVQLSPELPAKRAMFSTLTEEEFLKLPMDSHPTTCTLDLMPFNLLQTMSSALNPAVTYIINSSLATDVFLTATRQAQVAPLLKKPTLDPAQVKNCRPVSLLTFFSKIIGHTILNQFSAFLSDNNLYNLNRSGFKQGHSTDSALLLVTESLRSARAFGQSSVLLLSDLSAVFDTVNCIIPSSSC